MPLLLRSMRSSGISSTRTARAPLPGARFSFFSSGLRAGALWRYSNVFQLPQSGQRPSHFGVS